ncbi:ribonuclease P protein component [Rarobacter faecitabidus]|uniref:Ribonuclease P protein component n=1 Tax=Rarobacter faecitabidus TaxID=13243 RepID=A0A542ZPP8_RARFA|nr:ribonuclease P protein component [Rarobacter faecitabidus]
MLPAERRLRRSDEFQLVIRKGVRSGRTNIVVHMARAAGEMPARAGLVVSKSVGNAVERNLVKRRIRNILRPLLAASPPGRIVVVRALPGCARVSFEELAGQVESAFEQSCRRLVSRETKAGSVVEPC